MFATTGGASPLALNEKPWVDGCCSPRAEHPGGEVKLVRSDILYRKDLAAIRQDLAAIKTRLGI